MTAKEKEVIDEMLKLIGKINDSTDRLSEKQRVPELELSAIVSKIKTLYETAIVLKYLHANADELIIKEVENKVLEIDSKQKELEEKLVEGEVDENLSNTVVEQSTIVPTPDINIDRVPDPPAGKQQETKELGIEKKTNSVNEKSHSHPPTLGDRFKGKEIADLKTAIGLNEKFLFTNELFGGDQQSFSNAIEALNHLSSLQEAEEYLKEASQLHNWDRESTAVGTFYDLLERRYKR